MLKKRLLFIVILNLLLLTLPGPVMAAQGDDGDLHFGSYSLSAGETEYGDQVVFGEANIGEGAYLDGDLVVFGDAYIAGEIDGSVFCAGTTRLKDTAHVYGDISSIGTVIQDEGSIVDGDITYVDDTTEFEWVNFPGMVPFQFSPPRPQHQPWLDAVGKVLRGFMTLIIMGLLALVIISIWPKHVERVGDTIMESPLMTFGVGFLTFLVSAIVLMILLLTICLSPFALLGAVALGVALVFGWIAIGLKLGQRIFNGLATQSQSIALPAIVGTLIITLVMVMANLVWGFLYFVLICLLASPAIGAVVLTRFGSVPYASRGQLPPTHTLPPSAPVPPAPPVPAQEVPAPEMPAAVAETRFETLEETVAEDGGIEIPPIPDVPEISGEVEETSETEE